MCISGIFGNSIDELDIPSWQVMTSKRSGYVSAGIATDEDDNLEDFPYSAVSPNPNCETVAVAPYF